MAGGIEQKRRNREFMDTDNSVVVARGGGEGGGDMW